jgi:hypothetical protein
VAVNLGRSGNREKKGAGTTLTLDLGALDQLGQP